MTTEKTREELAAESLGVPRGVSGSRRSDYLSLTDAQKAIYRRHFYVAGRFAQHSFRYAVKNIDLGDVWKLR